MHAFAVGQLPYLLDRLKQTQVDGGSLIEKTLVVWGSPMSDPNVHNHRRCPMMLFGKANGMLKGNLPIKTAADTPMAIQMVSVMCASVIVSHVFTRYGRKAGFWLGSAIAFSGSVTFATGIYNHNFALYRLGAIPAGIAHGIGAALYEEFAYNDDGLLVAQNFMDYLLPSSHEVPPVEMVHHVTPSPHTVFGQKGSGESGYLGAPAAIAARPAATIQRFRLRTNAVARSRDLRNVTVASGPCQVVLSASHPVVGSTGLSPTGPFRTSPSVGYRSRTAASSIGTASTSCPSRSCPSPGAATQPHGAPFGRNSLSTGSTAAAIPLSSCSPLMMSTGAPRCAAVSDAPVRFGREPTRTAAISQPRSRDSKRARCERITAREVDRWRQIIGERARPLAAAVGKA